MTIVRIDAEARWSDVVIHNQTLYYTGVPSNLDADAFEQTADTGADRCGAGKARQRQIAYSGRHHFPANKDDFAAMNKAGMRGWWRVTRLYVVPYRPR